MKIAVMIIGILGSLAILGLGAKWVSDYSKYADKIAAVQEMAERLGKTDIAPMKELSNLKTAGYLMIVFGILSFLAAVMVSKLKKISGAVMLAAVIIPAIFAPKSLVFSFLLLISGVLALLIKPKAA